MSRNRPTEAQRAADVRDAIDAARAEGDSLQAARLWVVEAWRRERVAMADLDYEKTKLPPERRSKDLIQKAEEALKEAEAVRKRATDALRPLETEEAGRVLQELREQQRRRERDEAPLFAKVHRNFNRGVGDG